MELSMLSNRQCGALVFACLCALSPVASANDWYVDVANGNNLNDGASPATAWRTITFAVQAVPSGSVETIHIAPGLYNPVHGEVFPILLRPEQQLIGQPGGAKPILAADNLDLPVIRIASTLVNAAVFSPQTRVENLSLRRATTGIEVYTEAGAARPRIVDVDIENTAFFGVRVRSFGGSNAPTLERVNILPDFATQNFECISIEGSAGNGPEVRLERCNFIEASQAGISVLGEARLELSRCFFAETGVAFGLHGVPDAETTVLCTDSVFSYASRVVVANLDLGEARLRFERCTMAENSNIALASANGGTLELEFESSIVSSTGPAFVTLGNVTVNATRCLVSDGSFDGINGCFSGDPGFRQGEDGEFRLGWGSPCIDAALVNAPPDTRDVVGSPRDLDGNLDTLGKTDIGAYEFQPLELTTTGAIGSSLMLENWGPNAPSTIYWARTGLASPSATPFGTFQLNSQFARPFRFTTAGASTPNVTLRPIPNQIALVGHTFSFQALTDSPAAPLARAFTNGVEFSVTP
jgi:hypothetical protein